MENKVKFRVDDPILKRHWCPKSEMFTGADSLLTALYRGWQITDYGIDSSYGCVTQSVTIYVFDLQRDGEAVQMKVVANPFVERFMSRYERQLVYGH